MQKIKMRCFCRKSSTVNAIFLLTISMLLLTMTNIAHSASPFSLRLKDEAGTTSEAENHERFLTTCRRFPLRFEPNSGQTHKNVRFFARGMDYTLFLTPLEAVIALPSMHNSEVAAAQPEKVETKTSKAEAKTVLRMRLVGANLNPTITGLEELPGKSHYFFGKDRGRWQTGVAGYARVKYLDVYPGIDLVYYGNQGELEFDFITYPGADPEVIKIVFVGAEEIFLDARGNMRLRAAGKTFRMHVPIIFQQINGVRKQVAGQYVLDDAKQVSFKIAAYDPRRLLVIDPRLHYSTYLGGEGSDRAFDIARDSDGNFLVSGATASPDFPLQNPIRDDLIGSEDAFVTKFNPTLSAIIYSTYLGGSGDDRSYGIAIDLDGNAYLTGFTSSINFPVTEDSLDTDCGTDGFCNPDVGETSIFQHTDAFVTKLNPLGSLVYSTYLGGSQIDSGQGIAVDGVGAAYVTGYTMSADFPTTRGAFQTSCSGGNPLANFCNRDAFVAKLNPAGNELIYATFFGGNGREDAYDIALDPNPGIASPAYVTGMTSSPSEFPVTLDAFQTYNPGGSDAFVMKLNALGSALVYSTHLGGNGDEWARSVAVDDAGNAYVTGTTYSTDFPTTPGAFDTTCGTDGNCNNTGEGNWVDAFVTKVNPTGSALLYSTYLGGSNKEFGEGIAVLMAGDESQAYVTGKTLSDEFPAVHSIQNAFGDLDISGGSGDVFVTRFNSSGNALVYSTYLGGVGPDGGRGITVDDRGNAYVTGNTTSDNFPTTFGTYESDLQNPVLVREDAFVARIGEGYVFPPLDLFWQLAIYLAVLFFAGLIFFGWRLKDDYRTRR